jgi:hypothetical protein
MPMRHPERWNAKHSVAETPTYWTWCSMIERCRAHPDYAGRGIKVCARWRKFENFFADMGARPEGCTLDRKDNDKGYNPGNCRWATSSQQSGNRRRWRYDAERMKRWHEYLNELLTLEGKTK